MRVVDPHFVSGFYAWDPFQQYIRRSHRITPSPSLIWLGRVTLTAGSGGFCSFEAKTTWMTGDDIPERKTYKFGQKA